MMAYDRELNVFETDLNSDRIINNNRGRKHLHISKKVKKLRLQVQNDVNMGIEYLDLNHRSQLHFNGLDMQAVGSLLPSPDPDMELNKYLNFDSNVAANQREDLEAGRNQSLDDFFQDFQEIISSEMKPIVSTSSTTTPYHRVHDNTATTIIPYGEPSAGYISNISGVDFNLDLTQFYINTNEADFMNADELKTDLSNGLIPFQSPQFTNHDKVADDSPEFSVIDLSTGNTEIYGRPYTRNSATSKSEAVDSQLEFSTTVKSDQEKEMAEYSDTKISVSTPLNQFYLDFKLNGETSTASDTVDNSIVTYISKDVLQSVEYINESGGTETVMYVDQQSNEKNSSAVTQYEIINFDEYQYQTENADQLQLTSNSELLPDISEVPDYGNNLETIPQTDILSTLLLDKSNKITVISKPFKNPKVRQSSDDFFLKLEEIDANPTNIAFAQQPKAKGCRKQKLETINQIELEIVEPRPARSDKVIPPATPTSTHTPTTAIPETPKLPSRFMRDRKMRMEAKRKRPRKLAWDRESDSENGGSSKKKSKSNIR